ncbi:MAG: hypothetical protein QW587_06760 [Candidatus Bathyarchaeia archaeon]
MFAAFLCGTVSPSLVSGADEVEFAELIEPATETVMQGENFTLKVTAFVNQTKVYAIKIWASVIFPFMEIIDANYTVVAEKLIGPIYPTTLNFSRNSVNFSTYVLPPANVTVTAVVFCSMPGSFYLPAASLWVGDVNMTEYRSNRAGPLTVTPRTETLKLDDLRAEVTEVKAALRQLAAELNAAKAQLQDLEDRAAGLRADVGVVNASINRVEAATSAANSKLDTIDAELEAVRVTVEATQSRLEREVTWLLLGAVALAAVSSAGAWVAAAYTARRPRPSA